MTYQVSLYTMQCCELYMVSQTDDYELYLSSYKHIRRARLFFVKNLLRKSYKICCVTRQESIHAVAYFPTRVCVFSVTVTWRHLQPRWPTEYTQLSINLAETKSPLFLYFTDVFMHQPASMFKHSSTAIYICIQTYVFKPCLGINKALFVITWFKT